MLKGKTDTKTNRGTIWAEKLSTEKNRQCRSLETSSLGFASKTSKTSLGVYCMLPSARERVENKHMFTKNYNYLCTLNNTVPKVKVKPDDHLEFYGDRIRTEDWPPIIKAIASDHTLKSIRILSYNLINTGAIKQPPIGRIKLLSELVSAVCKTMSASKLLVSVELQSLHLTVKHVQMLSEALKFSNTIQLFGLSHCSVGDESCETLCTTLRYRPLINTLDLTGCGITHKGAESIAQMIQVQKMVRYGECWQQSLRYRRPNTGSAVGLKRILLDGNVQLGDTGFTTLMNALADDLWIKEISCKNCGLTNDGAQKAVAIVRNNITISVLDIRRNMEVDSDYVKQIENIIQTNHGNDQPPGVSVEENCSETNEMLMQRSNSTCHLNSKRSTATCCCCCHSLGHWRPPSTLSSSAPAHFSRLPGPILKRTSADIGGGPEGPTAFYSETFYNGSSACISDTKELSDLEKARRALDETTELLNLETAQRTAIEERCQYLEGQLKKQGNCVLVEKDLLETMIVTFQQFTTLFNDARKAGLDEFLKLKKNAGNEFAGSQSDSNTNNSARRRRRKERERRVAGAETTSDTNALATTAGTNDEVPSLDIHKLSSLSDDSHLRIADPTKRAQTLFIKLLKQSTADAKKKSLKHQT